MRTRKLGALEVGVTGLGCNKFGGRIGADETRVVVDAALDAGVTFFDTADIYGGQGGSEELLGRILAGRRDRVVLATKWGKPMGDGATRRGSRDYIRGAVEGSLRRLQTDVIDLYQHPEEDPGTPLHGRTLAPADVDRVERLCAWAEAHGRTLLEVAIGGLAAVTPVVSVIAGATRPEQVRANAAAGAWEPTAEELGELRALA